MGILQTRDKKRRATFVTRHTGQGDRADRLGPSGCLAARPGPDLRILATRIDSEARGFPPRTPIVFKRNASVNPFPIVAIAEVELREKNRWIKGCQTGIFYILVLAPFGFSRITRRTSTLLPRTGYFRLFQWRISPGLPLTRGMLSQWAFPVKQFELSIFPI